MDTLDCMRVFAAVVERQGFSAAAEALQLSTASVTRQVAYLEKRLGTRLLNRTTRRVSLSTAGAAYYERCQRLLAELDETEAAVAAQTLRPAGALRINAPVSFGIGHLGDRLARFCERYPEISLEVSLADRLVDLVEEGFDLAVRITREPAPSLVARKLADLPIWLCASPAYLRRHGRPRRPQELSAHRCLSYTYWSGGDIWRLRGPAGEEAVKVGGHLRANNGDLLCAAARSGMGIVLQPEFLISRDLAEGRLQRVLPDYDVAPTALWIVYASRHYLPPKLRAFVDYLVEDFRREPLA